MLASKLSSSVGNNSASANYIEDVFSTYLYTGTAANQTIANNVNLSTYGGLVWLKSRSVSGNNWTQDSVRGVNSVLYPNLTNAAGNPTGTAVSAFNTNGFSLGSNTNINNTGDTYVSWTFRKQPKFFDIVTYTGTGANRTIAHNLGSVPGCIIVKRTDIGGYNWNVYHSGLSTAAYSILLNGTNAESSTPTYWNSTNPTSTVFSLGTNIQTNASGGSYVAYIFASNAGGFGLSGTDNVITCGTFTAGATVNLGYEPQWLMWKRTDTASNWQIIDTMRGWTADGNENYLQANTTAAEANISPWPYPTATGFTALNQTGANYIYIAIRRGPMKVPTDATKAFSPITYTGVGAIDSRNIGWPVDFLLSTSRSGYGGLGWGLWDRLRGTNGTANRTLVLPSTGAEQTGGEADISSFDQFGVSYGNSAGWGFANISGVSYSQYFFQRAPSFFDEVCYTGTGSATTFNHNLGVAPELMIVKRRNSTGAWCVFQQDVGASNYLLVNSTAAQATSSQFWNDTYPTSSVFTVGTNGSVNANGGTYVAYLFATCAGVSKVGSYTGTGTTKQVDCGFAAGARFVLIKRTDSTGDWYVWDSARGIVSGNDPYLLLNSTAAEVTTTDYIDTYSAGFEISSTAPAAINASGGTFIFLAIA